MYLGFVPHNAEMSHTRTHCGSGFRPHLKWENGINQMTRRLHLLDVSTHAVRAKRWMEACYIFIKTKTS